METEPFYIAEFNISRLKAPLDSPSMKEFVDFLDPVNKFAEESPGFVWRLAAPNGMGSSYLPPAFEDEMVAVTLSVWKSIDALKAFAYQSVHTYFLRSKKKWFDQIADYYVVLWWIPPGHTPTVEEAKQKLTHLKEHGPTPGAFTLQTPFDRDGNPLSGSREGVQRE